MNSGTDRHFDFAAGSLEKALDSFKEKDIRQFTVYDRQLTSSKDSLIRFMKAAARKTPDVLFDIHLPHTVIDRQVAETASELYCSLSVDIPADWQNQRKSLEKKCALLNDMGLVFGFDADCSAFDSELFSVKSFRELLDFLTQQYPNHMYFSLEGVKAGPRLSTQDITLLKNLSFAAEAFYTEGRAVPWFLTVLNPLRLRPSAFLSDFAEWQRCNNCGPSSGFSLEGASHAELEKMQLAFLKFKYEEKKMPHVYPAVEDMVSLQGAFSRAAFEGEETVLDLSYSPDDLFSPFAQDIQKFVDEVCMEACSIRVYPGEYEPEWAPVRS